MRSSMSNTLWIRSRTRRRFSVMQPRVRYTVDSEWSRLHRASRTRHAAPGIGREARWYSRWMHSSAASSVVVGPASGPVSGRQVSVPGDKSISHRYGMLSALADGQSVIENYAPGADCRSTLHCLSQLGVAIAIEPAPGVGPRITVEGRGLRGLKASADPLDAGNSGSTMRMMAGVLAAHPFASTMTGDDSLSRRPMRRVIVPLERMGARIASNEGKPPLTIE